MTEKYEPACSKWSLGRCAVCRPIEDHDYEKMIICNRCQIDFHQKCRELELTMGANKHTDPSFLTILLQDSNDDLQFLHENQWIDVLPLAGSLVVNIGDLLQIVLNDKFKSTEHRVLVNHAGPRISMASFFTGVVVPGKVYGPIKELIAKGNPAIYKEFIVSDYIKRFYSRSGGLCGELTVRETLDFSGHFLGVGTRYDLLPGLSRRERDLGIKPDAEIDAFMKATTMLGQHSSLVTNYVLKILGLDICADIMVGM